MFLYINTTSSEFIILALAQKTGEVLKLKKIKAPYQQSEKLLIEIERLLNFQYSIFNIKGIIVFSGPGSFTSLRIGIATANAIGWACQIPIIGVEWNNSSSDEELIKKSAPKLAKIKVFKQVLPQYGQEPNIGKSKK
jgi:tRNA threonylcarbamoyl adenosine modification protein YeaZ